MPISGTNDRTSRSIEHVTNATSGLAFKFNFQTMQIFSVLFVFAFSSLTLANPAPEPNMNSLMREAFNVVGRDAAARRRAARLSQSRYTTNSQSNLSKRNETFEEKIRKEQMQNIWQNTQNDLNVHESLAVPEGLFHNE